MSNSLQEFYNRPLKEIRVQSDFFLREQSFGDAGPFLQYYSNPEVNQHIYTTAPSTVQEAKEEIKYCRSLFNNRQGAYWSLAKINNNEIIGAVGLYIRDHFPTAEISYDLNKAYWRKGIMTDALTSIIEYAFNTIKIETVNAITTTSNFASMGLLKKLGFKHEGTLVNNRFYEGEYRDVEKLTLTKADFYAAISKTTEAAQFA